MAFREFLSNLQGKVDEMLGINPEINISLANLERLNPEALTDVDLLKTYIYDCDSLLKKVKTPKTLAKISGIRIRLESQKMSLMQNARAKDSKVPSPIQLITRD